MSVRRSFWSCSPPTQRSGRAARRLADRGRARPRCPQRRGRRRRCPRDLHGFARSGRPRRWRWRRPTTSPHHGCRRSARCCGTAVDGDVPTLGVCLGAQLLALATAAGLAPNPDGPEFGAQLIAKRAAAAADPLFGPLPITPDVIQWHVDAVTRLPAGAVQLASSPVCEVQAFRLGRLAWGIAVPHRDHPGPVVAVLGRGRRRRAWRLRRRRDPETGRGALTTTSSRCGSRSPQHSPRRPPTPTPSPARDARSSARRADHRPGCDPGGARRRAGAVASSAHAADAGHAATGRPSDPAASRTPSRLALRLARLSFADGAAPPSCSPGRCCAGGIRCATLRSTNGAAAVVAALGRTADPDAALAALDADRRRPTAAPTAGGAQPRAACYAADCSTCSAVSPELADHLVEHPADWQVLTATTTRRGRVSRLAGRRRCGPERPGHRHERAPGQAARFGRCRLRCVAAYRRELVAIAGRDLQRRARPGRGHRGARRSGRLHCCRRPRGRRGRAAAGCRRPAGWPSIAMGKAGGRELNYVSDVDVIFVAEPVDAAEPATPRRARRRRRGSPPRRCGSATQVAWEVDAGLRPEGKDGPLVRTLASHEAYYRRWASTWEFQALLKARPVAGDARARARATQDVIAPLVWTAAERADFVADVRAMRRRVVEHIPRRRRRRARSSSVPAGCATSSSRFSCCSSCTGAATSRCACRRRCRRSRRLRDGGYVGRDDALSLIDAYRFLRDGRAPAAAAAAAAHARRARRHRSAALAGRAMGFRPDARGDARAVFEAEWALHAREVRRLHEKLFYRPLLEAVARVPTEGLRLTPEQARLRLSALGLRAIPDAALRHIESLTAGLSRRATLQRSAAAGVAVGLRRRTRPRPRPAGLPASLRRARRDAVVPTAASRRGRRGIAAWPTCWGPAATSRGCSAGHPRRCSCSPTTSRSRRETAQTSSRRCSSRHSGRAILLRRSR